MKTALNLRNSSKRKQSNNSFSNFVAVNVRLHGASPWHPEVACQSLVAVNVKLHGTSPWHLIEL
jgi:hypothetical protein